MSDLGRLTTEARNPATIDIDAMSAREIARVMNEQDSLVAGAVSSQEPVIAAAIDAVAKCLREGGRLIYLGAGTSGRLGVLDATECPPTFNSPPGQVIGLIAGGPEAITRAVEGAEDRPELAEQDLTAAQLSNRDVVVGIATSGRTPYVIGGLQFARRRGCVTVAISCNADSSVAEHADLAITAVVGPEVISGSTRLKAGTATKMVLNMLTTGAMVRIGKTYGNLMVDLRATNTKLRDRARRIVESLVNLDSAAAAELLRQCGGELKTAIVAGRVQCSPDEARQRLHAAEGQVRRAIEQTNERAAQAAGLGHLSAAGDRMQPVTTDLILGIDGGGSHTLAIVARAASDGRYEVLGRGETGPSNYHAVGRDRALASLDQAIDQAFSAAQLPRTCVAAACFGLAGADRPDDRAMFLGWSNECAIAQHVAIENDGSLVLAAGTPNAWGIALIAGTGSFAYARTAEGRVARAGGWGYRLGDEGSAFWIAQQALYAIARSADGRGPDTQLQEMVRTDLGIERIEQMIAVVHDSKFDRVRVAGLAELVTHAASVGDEVSTAILRNAARELADSVRAAARVFPATLPLPLALAGGVLVSCELVRTELLRLLNETIEVQPVQLVTEPVYGAVRIARDAVRSCG